jgi:hypothetical protein
VVLDNEAMLGLKKAEAGDDVVAIKKKGKKSKSKSKLGKKKEEVGS